MYSFISVLPNLAHVRRASVSSFSQAKMKSCRFEGWHWPSFQPVTPHTRARSSYICLLETAALHCSCACFLVQPRAEGRPARRLLVFPPRVWRGLAQPITSCAARSTRCAYLHCVGPCTKRRLVSACNASQVSVVSPFWFWRRSINYIVKHNSLERQFTTDKCVQLLVRNK